MGLHLPAFVHVCTLHACTRVNLLFAHTWCLHHACKLVSCVYFKHSTIVINIIYSTSFFKKDFVLVCFGHAFRCAIIAASSCPTGRDSPFNYKENMYCHGRMWTCPSLLA